MIQTATGHIENRTGGEKLKLDPSVRRAWELKADCGDDGITREVVALLAKKGLSVDRASRILEDARSMIPRLAKIPYFDEPK